MVRFVTLAEALVVGRASREGIWGTLAIPGWRWVPDGPATAAVGAVAVAVVGTVSPAPGPVVVVAAAVVVVAVVVVEDAQVFGTLLDAILTRRRMAGN